VLQVVDDALCSATKAQKKTLKDVDENFQKAIDALSAYERIYHPYLKTPVAERMEIAEEEDTSSLKFLNRLKEDCRVREVFASLLYCYSVILTLIRSR
jgi:hypothetical protein